ncbi:rhomboid family intramembrane serine protease [Verrucomicrobiales bacterium BCK34]|nr:rhomboid family intramembrane serine protease [Verrucomicrobiales bacterium BCK34]
MSIPPDLPRRSVSRQPPALPTDHRREQWGLAMKDNLALLVGAVVIAWGLQIADLVTFSFLDNFGIKPRTLSGLFGILAAPFLHGGFGHLLSNTLPFLMLGGIVLIGGRKLFVAISLFIIAIGGGALWTVGPGGTNHIGASLLIFGYLGFLLARGVVEKSTFWIVVSVIVLVLYGGMLAGVLPGQEGISWQGHLFGFIAGVIGARVLLTGESRKKLTGTSLL